MISTAFAWCGLYQEDQNHLFWASTTWNFLCSWLSIGQIKLPNDSFDLFSMFSFNLDKDLAKHWRTFAASSLWTIWRTRNECNFQNTRASTCNVELLLKSTAHKWIKLSEGNSISYNGLDNIWDLNPLGYIKLHILKSRDILMSMLESMYDLVGFTDGAWSHNVKGLPKAGIGGIVYKNKKVVFFFSGPISSNSPLETESLACQFLIKEIFNSNFKKDNVAICTDSFWLQEDFSRIKATDHTLGNIHVIFCDRDLNREADFLAKNCLSLPAIRSEWFWS